MYVREGIQKFAVRPNFVPNILDYNNWEPYQGFSLSSFCLLSDMSGLITHDNEKAVVISS